MSTLPRVTEILKGSGLVPMAHFTDFSREKGSAVHLACQYFDDGTLDEDSVDPLIAGRLDAYRNFLAETGPTILAIEEEVENTSYQYRGHLDRRLTLFGAEGVLDIKPPTMAPWHSLQLQFYAMCFDKVMRRWSLHLSDNGRYQLVEHRESSDRAVVRAIMALWNWRQRHGV